MPHLPDELLLDIFELIPSRHDLAQITYSCKTFANVVKPVLYSHNRIEDMDQRNRLRRVRREDGEFVKKVTITGDWGSTREYRALSKDKYKRYLWKWGEVDEGIEETGRLGTGLVQELVEGKLFNVQTLERIVVKNLTEEPRIELQRPPVVPSILVNLRTISIWCHRGSSSSQIWEVVLQKKFLPSLRHLAVCDDTSRYHRHRGSIYNEDVSDCLLSKTDLLDQLEILASPRYLFLSNYPQFIHLATVSPQHCHLSSSTEYAIILINNGVGPAVEDMAQFVRPFEETMELAVEKGVKVCYDRREDGLIPQSFIDFLAEKKKRKEEEEEK
ncbi:uncharacterized protein JCM6883_001216 [Sporobolomyces salmoneus]|uniref:uncharacterized protein n=1 Tax=Sporobolomyces salmoneus TaxID=183962 RepID=UPI00317E9481